MKKTIYAVSDIHGDFMALLRGLKDAGFNENDENTLLISLGDTFDRGTESIEVYKFLHRLQEKGKAIILKGNHTNFFIDYLNGNSFSTFNYLNNGTNTTLASFLGQNTTNPFLKWFQAKTNNTSTYPTGADFLEWLLIARKKINKDYPTLLKEMENLPYYYETKNYIFTHGAIDTMSPDWRKPHITLRNLLDWDALNFDDGSFFGKEINNTDKTIVIGHFGTRHLRKIYNLGPDTDDSILVREDKRVIAIDATTILSHKVNVLVIKDEELLD